LSAFEVIDAAGSSATHCSMNAANSADSASTAGNALVVRSGQGR
jgi:hypothetical protein